MRPVPTFEVLEAIFTINNMAPSRKTEVALMSMMERFLESNTSCECDDCKRSTQGFKKVSASLPRRNYDKENGSPARNSDRYLCSEHRGTPISKRPPPRDKFATNTTTPMNRADKVNILLKADTVQDVLEVFKSTPTIYRKL